MSRDLGKEENIQFPGDEDRPAEIDNGLTLRANGIIFSVYS